MKAYGLGRRNHDDVDTAGCVENGRPTALVNPPGLGGDARAPRGLRGGKRAAARRPLKRGARREGREACALGE